MSETPDGFVTSAVLSTFFPDGEPAGRTDARQFHTSQRWQQLGHGAQTAEIHGALAGKPLGYVAELLGRGAAAGEQLGLSLTAVRDAEAWVAIAPKPGQENRRTIAGRAMAEASGLWSLSAAHAAINVVGRVVRMHGSTEPFDTKLKWKGLPDPFVENKKSNLSFNEPTVQVLADAAAATTSTPLTALVAPLTALVGNPAWTALMNRRNVGYHRWRPQSVSGGASTTNPWVDTGDGSGSQTMSIGVSPSHVPPALEPVVAESRAGHDALSQTMADVLDALPAALESFGIKVL